MPSGAYFQGRMLTSPFNDLLLLALMDVNEIAVKIYHIYDLAVTEILSDFTTKLLVFNIWGQKELLKLTSKLIKYATSLKNVKLHIKLHYNGPEVGRKQYHDSKGLSNPYTDPIIASISIEKAFFKLFSMN